MQFFSVEPLIYVVLRSVIPPNISFFMRAHWAVYECKIILVNFLRPWTRLFVEKLTVSQLVKTFPAFDGHVPSTAPHASCQHPVSCVLCPVSCVLTLRLVP
jgi:hypothetical protein